MPSFHCLALRHSDKFTLHLILMKVTIQALFSPFLLGIGAVTKEILCWRVCVCVCVCKSSLEQW